MPSLYGLFSIENKRRLCVVLLACSLPGLSGAAANEDGEASTESSLVEGCITPPKIKLPKRIKSSEDFRRGLAEIENVLSRTSSYISCVDGYLLSKPEDGKLASKVIKEREKFVSKMVIEISEWNEKYHDYASLSSE